MQLHYVSRAEYRQKSESHYQKKLYEQFGNVYILPEGGSNALAIKGCAEIVDEINHELEADFDVICCASGTGATLAGIASRINEHQIAIGFSALKGGEFLNQDVAQFLPTKQPAKNWRIETRFHFGGYARADEKLLQFIKDFKKEYGFMLDAVYTGKMFYGLFQMIKAKEFESGTCIVVIHSGGLQGNAGFKL